MMEQLRQQQADDEAQSSASEDMLQSTQRHPYNPTCPECGSHNVHTNADVFWNAFGGYWQISDGFDPDTVSCIDCETTWGIQR